MAHGMLRILSFCSIFLTWKWCILFKIVICDSSQVDQQLCGIWKPIQWIIYFLKYFGEFCFNWYRQQFHYWRCLVWLGITINIDLIEVIRIFGIFLVVVCNPIDKDVMVDINRFYIYLFVQKYFTEPFCNC